MYVVEVVIVLLIVIVAMTVGGIVWIFMDAERFNGLTGQRGLTGAQGAQGAQGGVGPVGPTGSATGGGGSLSLAPIGSIPNANGASVSGTTVLTLQPASDLFGGLVTTTGQTIAGNKAFVGQIEFPEGPSQGIIFDNSTSTPFPLHGNTIDFDGGAPWVGPWLATNLQEIDYTRVSGHVIINFNEIIDTNAGATAPITATLDFPDYYINENHSMSGTCSVVDNGVEKLGTWTLDDTTGLLTIYAGPIGTPFAGSGSSPAGFHSFAATFLGSYG